MKLSFELEGYPTSTLIRSLNLRKDSPNSIFDNYLNDLPLAKIKAQDLLKRRILNQSHEKMRKSVFAEPSGQLKKRLEISPKDQSEERLYLQQNVKKYSKNQSMNGTLLRGDSNLANRQSLYLFPYLDRYKKIQSNELNSQNFRSPFDRDSIELNDKKVQRANKKRKQENFQVKRLNVCDRAQKRMVKMKLFFDRKKNLVNRLEKRYQSIDRQACTTDSQSEIISKYYTITPVFSSIERNKNTTKRCRPSENLSTKPKNPITPWQYFMESKTTENNWQRTP